MGTIALRALGLDVPAIGLNARNGGEDGSRDAFFGLLANHLASTGASDTAISVIEGKISGEGEEVSQGTDGDDGETGGFATVIPIAGTVAPIADLPANSEASAAEVASVVGPIPTLPVLEAHESAEAQELPEAQVPALPEPPVEIIEPALEALIVDVPEAPMQPAAHDRAVPEPTSDGPEPPLPIDMESPPGIPPDAVSDDSQGVVRTVGNADQANENQVLLDDIFASAIAGDDVQAPAPAPPTEAAPNIVSATLQSASGPSLDASADATGVADVESPAPPDPLQQIAEVVVDIDADGGEARLMLDPPDLGEVLVRLQTRGDQVRIEVFVERPEALQMLRDGSQSLQSLLAQRGLDLGGAAFFLSRHHGQETDGQGDAPQSSEGGFAGLLGFDEPGTATSQHNLHRLRAAYNPDGALLYRV